MRFNDSIRAHEFDCMYEEQDAELFNSEVENPETDKKCPLCGSSSLARPLEVGISGEGVDPTYNIESKQYPIFYELVVKFVGLL